MASIDNEFKGALEENVIHVGYSDDVVDGSNMIASKDAGTLADREDMVMLGKKQVLKRRFKFLSTLGFASTVVASWEVVLPTFTFAITDGGTAGMFWGYIIVAIGLLFVYASIAELASMAPTAGGQYHFVSEIAPPRAQKLLSYLVGWLTAIGWQLYLTGVCYITAILIQGLIVLNVDSYVWHTWHGVLLTVAVLTFGITVNWFLAPYLPWLSIACFVLHFTGFFAVVITLWATGPIGDARSVVLDFSTSGGWSSVGLATMIGLISPLSSLVGYDCSVHMSEEINDASLQLPKAIMSSVYLNSILSVLLAITLAFTAGNVAEILQTPTGQPFIAVFLNATGSKAATSILTAIVIIVEAGSCISEVATTSRQIWSFARDGGLPFSNFLSKVSSHWSVPLNAVTVSVIVSTLMACISLGSTNALNAIISLGCNSILTSYLITISCVVWRRTTGPPLPSRRWSLGKFGLAINIISVLFLAPVWVFMWWPLGIPVTAASMNWSSVIFAGLLALASLHYLIRARHTYTGPVAYVKRLD